MTSERKAAIVAAVNLKGGAGKTTVVLNLATALQRLKNRVAVLDLDPQGSAAQWAASGEGLNPFTVEAVDVADNPAALREALDRVDAEIVLIDTPPQIGDAAMLAALVARLVLVPVQPSAFDVWAAHAAVDLCWEARRERVSKGAERNRMRAHRAFGVQSAPLPMVSLVPSRVADRTIAGRKLPELLREIGERVAPAISNRVALAAATIAGTTVKPKSPAGLEFAALARHVLRRMSGMSFSSNPSAGDYYAPARWSESAPIGR